MTPQSREAKAMLSFRIVICVLFVVIETGISYHDKHFYPESVPEYLVRKDVHTNHTVSRGHLHRINYDVSSDNFPVYDDAQKDKMVSFDDFQRHLQCASPEAEMDGTRGGWSMLQMAPPTKETVVQVCAWAESNCHPWVECRHKVEEYKSGAYEKGKASEIMDELWGTFRNPVLMRVLDNELYYDWPWGLERFTVEADLYSERFTNHYALLEIVLRIVKDIGDSAFFFAGERAFSKWNMPFPTFSFAPSLSSADFPFPWYESFRQEVDLYSKAQGAGNNFTTSFYQQSHRPWGKRKPRAAFFSTIQSYRQLVYDSAKLRPDLFDVSFIMGGDRIAAWNPLSDEPLLMIEERASFPVNSAETRAGFIGPILAFGDGRSYSPHNYKYVIVPVGSSDLSSSGRLAGLLAHSGAVVLLQQSTFAYHFSARLQPWVHYVPLSHSMADVIDKIEWLKRNDHMARQIAHNAQNFALSYLRLEDYLCYATGSLRLLHDLEKNTDVLEGFSPMKLPRNNDEKLYG